MKRKPKWLHVLGNTANGVFVVDNNQRILTWNKGAENLLGYPASEAIDRPCHEVIAGRLRGGKRWCCADCAVQRCIRRGTLLRDLDLLARTKGGRDIWLTVSTIALPTKDQPLSLHIVRRAARRERSEEALVQILRTLSAYGLTREIYESSRNARPDGDATPTPASTLSFLTPREMEVLGLLTRGYSTDEIARQLRVSVMTIRSHIRNMLRKANLHSRTDIVSMALRNGVF